MKRGTKIAKALLIAAGIILILFGFLAVYAQRDNLDMTFWEERGMLFASGGFSLILGIFWKGRNN